jgi:hypothetical protein
MPDTMGMVLLAESRLRLFVYLAESRLRPNGAAFQRTRARVFVRRLAKGVAFASEASNYAAPNTRPGRVGVVEPFGL